MPFVPDDEWQATLAEIDALKKHIAELEEKSVGLIVELKRVVDRQAKRITGLEEKNKRLEKRLAVYENPHTPPSMRKRWRKTANAFNRQHRCSKRA